MYYWSYMVLIDLLIPAVMFIVGSIFRRHPPKNISGIWGYRTRRSLKNPEIWDYANRYAGKIWYHWGLVMLPLSVVPMLFVINGTASQMSRTSVLTCLAELIPMIGANFLVEKNLREKFDADGNRKVPTEDGQD